MSKMNTTGRHLFQRKILLVLNKLDGGYMDPQQSEEQLFDILQVPTYHSNLLLITFLDF